MAEFFAFFRGGPYEGFKCPVRADEERSVIVQNRPARYQLFYEPILNKGGLRVGIARVFYYELFDYHQDGTWTYQFLETGEIHVD